MRRAALSNALGRAPSHTLPGSPPAANPTSSSTLLAEDREQRLGSIISATNPVEYTLGALVGCQVVTYRFWAARLGIRLDDVEIDAVGDLDVRGFFGLDDEVRAGFGDIRLDVRLTGPESPERYAELQQAGGCCCGGQCSSQQQPHWPPVPPVWPCPAAPHLLSSPHGPRRRVRPARGDHGLGA